MREPIRDDRSGRISNRELKAAASLCLFASATRCISNRELKEPDDVLREGDRLLLASQIEN